MKFFTLEDLESTPSRRHKVDQDEEFRCRARAVAFMLRCGHQLRLKYTTLYSAAIYFHTFFFRRSLKMHDKYDIATACLHFASKCEEDRKHLTEVIETAYYFKFFKKAPNPKQNAKNKQWRHEECTKIINKELILLQTLEFDFDTEQAFDFFPAIMNHWKFDKKYLLDACGAHKQHEIIAYYFKVAWFFVYDALKLVNIVMNAPEHIAIACVELAIRFVNIAYNRQTQHKMDSDSLTDEEKKNDQDFNFESLDLKQNMIPHELFDSEQCLLQISATWFKEFDDLLSATTVNSLCNEIVDICELEKDRKEKNNRNAMYIEKHLLKQPRCQQSNTDVASAYHGGDRDDPNNNVNVSSTTIKYQHHSNTY